MAIDEPRYLFYARFSGGDPQRSYWVDWGEPDLVQEGYRRHHGERPTALLRYDQEADADPAGARLREDGRWHLDFLAEEVFVGYSSLSEWKPVTPHDAREIAVALGLDPAVIDDPDIYQRSSAPAAPEQDGGPSADMPSEIVGVVSRRNPRWRKYLRRGKPRM